MNKGQLISAVAAKHGISQSAAKTQVDAFSEILAATLLAGEEVTLPGVGKLKVSTRPGRIGRNPATGVQISIPSKRVVKFTAASTFKDEVSVVTTA